MAIAGLDIIITNKDECIGCSACCYVAGETFFLDDEMQVIVVDNDIDEKECIISAAEACSQELIVIKDKSGVQLCP